MTGVVQKISEGRISVVVQKDQKHTQMISFDPTEYRSFQLGYTSTYFRAQGATVNKAYVLHSPHINKELFYVALTRHTDEAHYYLSKDEVPNLVALKNMALRDGGKESTVHFIGEHEQKELAKNETRQKEAEALKRSEQLGVKIKGFGLSTLNYLKEKGRAVLTYYEDKKHDKTFYHRQAEVEESRGVATTLTPHLEKTKILGSLKLLEEYLKPINEKVDVSKSSFVSAVINKSFAKNMPLAEQLKWGNIVYQYELRNKEVFQSRLEKASDYSEKEVEGWKSQKEAAGFLDGVNKVKKDLSRDHQINAKGEIVDRLAYQIMLFKAKLGYSPTNGQINMMKNVIQSCEKQWHFSMTEKGNAVELNAAKDKVYESLCCKALMGHKVKNIDIIEGGKAIKQDYDYLINLGQEQVKKSHEQQQNLQKAHQNDRGISL